MTYAKIVNDQIVKVGPTPNWRTDDGPLTPEQWIEQGYYPVVYNQQEYDSTLQRLAIKDFSQWIIEEDRVVATYTVTDIPLEELRETKLQEITDMRWQIMTGGVTLPGGIRVATTIEDQNRITSVVANAALVGLGDDDEVDFKAESGWAKVTIAQVKGIAGAVGQLVQACYTAERAHSEAIDLLETREAIAAYDVSTGWPS